MGKKKPAKHTERKKLMTSRDIYQNLRKYLLKYMPEFSGEEMLAPPEKVEDGDIGDRVSILCMSPMMMGTEKDGEPLHIQTLLRISDLYKQDACKEYEKIFNKYKRQANEEGISLSYHPLPGAIVIEASGICNANGLEIMVKVISEGKQKLQEARFIR